MPLLERETTRGGATVRGGRRDLGRGGVLARLICVLGCRGVARWRERLAATSASFGALACAVVLAACGATADFATPQERTAALGQFRQGQTELGCIVGCILPWLKNRQVAQALDAEGRWEDLAALVARINYREDLGYYYLGRAAEGLNLPGAAAHYYGQSYALSTGPLTGPQCRAVAGTCNGLDLLAVLPERLRSVQASLSQPPGRPLTRASTRGSRGTFSTPASFCRAVIDEDGFYSEYRKKGYTGPFNPPSIARDLNQPGFIWRCMDGDVWVCPYGVNPHHCRRNDYGLSPSPKVLQYCRQNPGSPIANIDNDTSLPWDCRGQTPVLLSPVRLDRRNYLPESWFALRG